MGRISSYRASTAIAGLLFPYSGLCCTAKGAGDADEVVAHRAAGPKESAGIQIRRPVREQFGPTHHEPACWNNAIARQPAAPHWVGLRLMIHATS